MTRSTATKLIATALTAGVLTGCVTTTTPQERGLSPTARDIAFVRFAQCGFVAEPQAAGLAGAIFASLATSAVTTGLNYLAEALKQAAEGVDSSAIGRTNIDLRQVRNGVDRREGNGEPSRLCIQVIRAPFQPATGNQLSCDDLFPVAEPDQYAVDRRLCQGGSSLNRLIWDPLPLAGPYEFLFEGAVRTVQGGGETPTEYWSIIPSYAELREPIERAGLRPDGDREVAMFLSFDIPGTRTNDTEAETKAGVAIVLGRLEEDEPIRYEPATDENGLLLPSPFESNLFSFSSEAIQTPLTAVVLITETQGRDRFLAFLSQVFAGAQEGIGAAINAEISGQ